MQDYEEFANAIKALRQFRIKYQSLFKKSDLLHRKMGLIKHVEASLNELGNESYIESVDSGDLTWNEYLEEIAHYKRDELLD
jgi:hypothetical protein